MIYTVLYVNIQVYNTSRQLFSETCGVPYSITLVYIPEKEYGYLKVIIKKVILRLILIKIVIT